MKAMKKNGKMVNIMNWGNYRVKYRPFLPVKRSVWFLKEWRLWFMCNSGWFCSHYMLLRSHAFFGVCFRTPALTNRHGSGRPAAAAEQGLWPTSDGNAELGQVCRAKPGLRSCLHKLWHMLSIAQFFYDR